MDVPPREELARQLRLSPTELWIVVLQHPETLGEDDSGAQMRAILDAVTEVGAEIVIIYPNSDPGSAKIIGAIQECERRTPRLRTFKSLAYPDYLALLRYAALLVGNSSSGLREAASFGLPFVNVGMRQSGRERGENVIDTASDRVSIARGIARALTDRTFRERALAGHNPYGDGKSAERIIALLADVALDSRLLRKAPSGRAEL
jgi:UDP-hydrolysing UDP-N-acetyl-D-glucosamine 2-epimerase